MAIELLAAASAGTVGPWVDCHSIGRNIIELRIEAFGGFTVDTVAIQESPDSGADFITLGTLTNGSTLLVESPVEWIRAVCGANMVGTATVFAEVSG